MASPTSPQARQPPGPPEHFRGVFSQGLPERRRSAEAAGPFRILPWAVATPLDVDDTATLVTWAASEGLALIPRGAGTGMPGGNVGPGVSVDLSGLSQVRRIDEESGIIEVGAGAVGATVQKAAAAASRFLPPMPSSADRCTIGGMVANNAAGARSFRYGAVRPSVEGVEAVLADGTVHRFTAGHGHPRFAGLRSVLDPDLVAHGRWPDVRKNASGYALDHFLHQGDALSLLVGSEGTLAVITRVWLRTAPIPQERAIVLLPLPHPEALELLVSEAGKMDASVCEFFGSRFLDIAGVRTHPDIGALVGSHPALALLEVDGDGEAVADALSSSALLARRLDVPVLVGRTEAQCQALWAVRHAASPVVAAKATDGLVSMQFIEDCVVPQRSLPDYLRGLEVILRGEETDAVVFGHAGDGNVHVNPLVDVRRPDWRNRVGRILDRTVSLVADLGGTLAGEHGDGRLRPPFHSRIYGPDIAEAFSTVKRTLDPKGTLNPGVVVALEGQDPLEGIRAGRARR